MKEVLSDQLAGSNLYVDCIYRGGRRGNSSDDPLPLLLRVSNQGGFRIIGSKEKPRLIVITSGMDDPDWPDELDRETGVLTYFGDNKKPGHELHDTPRYGNKLLRNMFDRAHASGSLRAEVPPVFVFAKAGSWRDMIFLGLAVPGTPSLDSNSDLIAVWKQRDGSRFQNYRARLTILDIPQIDRRWIADILAGDPLSENCPAVWKKWILGGIFCPLKAPRSLSHRTREEQLPQDDLGRSLLERLRAYFADDPYRFEACAARIAEMMLPDITDMDLTRRYRDGGRDATGHYRIGYGESAVLVDFALEAKRYNSSRSVGVEELSRLISRLRHRQFGILVTTSFVATQAYQEIKEDEHPIVIICAADIARLLIGHNLGSLDMLDEWLKVF